jgi:hypothetical protein
MSAVLILLVMHIPQRPNQSRQPVKFLTNKELLAEIHRCKTTYCSFVEPRFADYDAIVNSLSEVTDEFLRQTCERRSKELTPKKSKEPVIVVPDGLVIRLMTWEHIPLDPDRKKKARSNNKTHALVPFPPFKHYVIEHIANERVFREVGRSHWRGSLEDGHFDAEKGRVTERMGKMWDMFVERYGRKANWRGYSYICEMKSAALLQLCTAGLQFDESKSSNPFSFYTTTVTHAFTRVFQIEKKSQDIRDDLLIASGQSPSYTRQIAHEMAKFEPTKLAGKRGRKSLAQKEAEAKADGGEPLNT